MKKRHEYSKSNHLMLTKKQIEVLKSYEIDYHQEPKIILYEIDEILNNDYDETLDEISRDIAEMDYYNNSRK